MVVARTLLDQAREAIDVIQHALSELSRRELTEEQVEVLGGISDDLRAVRRFARVCAAIARLSDNQLDRVNQRGGWFLDVLLHMRLYTAALRHGHRTRKPRDLQHTRALGAILRERMAVAAVEMALTKAQLAARRR